MGKFKGKTNAMRLLKEKRLPYDSYSYEVHDGKIDGVSVAQKVGIDPNKVYKTLVTQGVSKAIYVYVIPVKDALDLKKAAQAAGEKKIDLLPVKDLQKWTGYIRGGCSPVGMKKNYPTFIDEQANTLNSIVVSGGKIGVQIELSLDSLISITQASLKPLVRD
ncbi:Cys-tRNA(Pro)/Cys-tRNA(Cys) deacylase [Pullulanibacillus pueri]|uniref:Cys-tRNA(Pro)/Cys-tRNA(Cys) deacylase n=1 Tax=Pullulanibacillus pueri TaxID=1437324 RepID=A0A8J2ZW12_9BACL|nr:Cys-tRNA(Pro) deacylase [Pullulanibacillus pueri]MBM7682449.1 Cys-tRNA(Pro)/Cys-tRNA(Cys) deacylase [Pullulanibacillus pueri]GGH81595.1 Cys-tRNA(Pro)/Cys-tRNA(Cys) deacylase [Pullulanibacillus pueri]